MMFTTIVRQIASVLTIHLFAATVGAVIQEGGPVSPPCGPAQQVSLSDPSSYSHITMSNVIVGQQPGYQCRQSYEINVPDGWLVQVWIREMKLPAGNSLNFYEASEKPAKLVKQCTGNLTQCSTYISSGNGLVLEYDLTAFDPSAKNQNSNLQEISIDLDTAMSGCMVMILNGGSFTVDVEVPEFDNTNSLDTIHLPEGNRTYAFVNVGSSIRLQATPSGNSTDVPIENGDCQNGALSIECTGSAPAQFTCGKMSAKKPTQKFNKLIRESMKRYNIAPKDLIRGPLKKKEAIQVESS